MRVHSPLRGAPSCGSSGWRYAGPHVRRTRAADLHRGPLALLRTPTDIFPNIDIPVVSIVWSYNGFSAEDMAKRITSNYERALTSDVDDIEHIESQSLNGVSVVKIFFHPGADINRAIAEASSNAASILRILPPGTLPPNIITYNASTVPILQLGLSSNSLAEQQLYDLGNSFIRTQLATRRGRAVRRQDPPDRRRSRHACAAGEGPREPMNERDAVRSSTQTTCR